MHFGVVKRATQRDIDKDEEKNLLQTNHIYVEIFVAIAELIAFSSLLCLH